MLRKIAPFGRLIAALLVLAGPAFAQVAPAPPDPLARIRAAASEGQVCTNSETSACAQANPKILAAAMGSPVLTQNLQVLAATGSRARGTPGMERAIAWAVTAFRAAGADAVSAEGYTDPAIVSAQRNVIAEIRGREKPDEFVVVAANLDSSIPGVATPDDDCNAALLVEAARDIHLTGLRPRRSIRFVLFDSRALGSWAYVSKHRSELDHAIAAVILENGCTGITGFNLTGREDLEPGVREALNFGPMELWGIAQDTYGAPLSGDNLDFLLEGVPSLTANRRLSSVTETDLETLRKNTAITGVLAFGFAEHATPLGPRLTRAEIDRLLVRTGLGERMHTIFVSVNTGVTVPPSPSMDLWQLWNTGRRGRQP